MSEHSKLPWIAREGGDVCVSERAICRSTMQLSWAEATANAEFIVKAVNAHQSLVDALEGLMTRFCGLDDRGKLTEVSNPYHQNLPWDLQTR